MTTISKKEMLMAMTDGRYKTSTLMRYSKERISVAYDFYTYMVERYPEKMEGIKTMCINNIVGKE